ncbi:PP2C family serine/threonine-protein phosphatase [Mycoplasma sp. Mirounga ES2805-ORL]|uniref:PP2C family protein-serine/threonine phosphatase n=1 Tax=Mycoplasma sp. Mirounga ES2805-ORL TaxID=754514 RepID=UPI00197BEEEA|nr:PP2C family serine/threonine-protein phosphatase [Mycoplasma sp. Mirounga ES2805-ORL]QSF13442.1 serine/threonine-protein phosphatase [Mycoplasma sp. Mirounga ES2805-ORL]
MKYGMKSDVGRVRLENQDRVGIFFNKNITLLILCDGMGGHFGGGLASSTTLNVFDKKFSTNFPVDKINDPYVISDWFRSTVNSARNEMIKISHNDEAKLDMGTTVTATIIDKENKIIYVFNIGDSRTYVLTRYGEIKQITIDHNLYNKLIAEGVPPVEAKMNRYHAALTSALGPQKTTKIELFDVSKHYDEISLFLATSDGVHDFIDLPILEQILRSELEPEAKCEELVFEALTNQSTDNCTAGIVVLDNK